MNTHETLGVLRTCSVTGWGGPARKFAIGSLLNGRFLSLSEVML
jgi:hypothetical protein